MNRITFALLLAGAALAAPLHAQEPLRVGERVMGRLEAGDARMKDGQLYDAFLLQGRPGERVVLRMSSGEFDTEVHVGAAGAGWTPLDSNDDAGPGTNSYLVVTLDRAGRAQVRAAALNEGEQGAYDLVTAPWRDPVPVPVAVGQERAGTLEGGDFVAVNGPEDFYTLRGTAGQTVTVSVASDDFDTQVSIGRRVQQAWEELEGNDDRGEGTNSQAVFTFPETGEYQIAVFGFEGSGLGAYLLRVDEGDVAAPEGAEDERAGQDIGGAYPETLLRADEPASGELSEDDPEMENGSRFRDYTWSGREGERLSIDLSADAFDAFLYLGTGTGEAFRELWSDDDGGEGRDARLVVTLPRTGAFTIRVSTLNAGEVGEYVLRVQSRR